MERFIKTISITLWVKIFIFLVTSDLVLTLSDMGGGGYISPDLFKNIITASLVLKSAYIFFDFSYLYIFKLLEHKF